MAQGAFGTSKRDPFSRTIGRLLAALNPEAFQSCFESWIATEAVAENGEDLNQIAIDGKVLRRNHDRRKGLRPLWLVSAWSADRGVSLGQLATDEKSNEITAIPELLENAEIKDVVVTIDAAGCQRKIAKAIMDGKGDYVLSLKGIQGKTHEAVSAYIEKHMENDFARHRNRSLPDVTLRLPPSHRSPSLAATMELVAH